jgi:hypothetical protein
VEEGLKMPRARVSRTRRQIAEARRLATFRSPGLLPNALSPIATSRLIEALKIPALPEVTDLPIDRVAEGLLLVAAVKMPTRNVLKEYKEASIIRGREFTITDEQADTLFRMPCH